MLAVPAQAAQAVADQLVEAGVKIIFNYSEQLLAGAARGHGPHLEPRRRPPLRALLLPRLASRCLRGRPQSLDLERAREVFEASSDFTIGLEEEFALVDPGDAGARAPVRGAPRRRLPTTGCSPSRPPAS